MFVKGRIFPILEPPCLSYLNWTNLVSSLLVQQVGRNIRLPVSARCSTWYTSPARAGRTVRRCLAQPVPKPVRSKERPLVPFCGLLVMRKCFSVLIIIFLPSQHLAAAAIVYKLAVVLCGVVSTKPWPQLLPVPSQRTLAAPSILIPAKNSSDRKC